MKTMRLFLIAFYLIGALTSISAFAVANDPDEVSSINLQDKKDLLIHYGINGDDIQKITINDFIKLNDTYPAVEFDRAEIAGNKRFVVTAVSYSNCCTSYPIPRLLAIYQKGKPMQTYLSDQMIHAWNFYQPNDKSFADDQFYIGITVGPTHGQCTNYLLYNIAQNKIVKDEPCIGYYTDHSGKKQNRPTPIPAWITKP